MTQDLNNEAYEAGMKAGKQITVRAQDVYGKTMFYPVDDNANLFCAIAGRTTLSEVNIRRIGDFVFPIEILVKFEDGHAVRELWDGKDHWRRFTYVRDSKLASVTIDPDNKIPIDVNLTNNSKSLEKKGSGVSKLTFASLFLTQTFLEQPELANLASLLGGLF